MISGLCDHEERVEDRNKGVLKKRRMKEEHWKGGRKEVGGL